MFPAELGVTQVRRFCFNACFHKKLDLEQGIHADHGEYRTPQGLPHTSSYRPDSLRLSLADASDIANR